MALSALLLLALVVNQDGPALRRYAGMVTVQGDLRCSIDAVDRLR